MKNKNLDCITDVQWSCKTWRRNGFKAVHVEPNQLRGRREVLEHSCVREKTQDPLMQGIRWSFIEA